MKHRENKWKNLQHTKELYDQHPRARSGQTTVIGTDRGHLMDGVERTDSNPWGNFVGTWDLPNKVPGNTAPIPTARSVHAADSLARHSHHATNIITGVQKNEDRQQIRARQMPIPSEFNMMSSNDDCAPVAAGPAYAAARYPEPDVSRSPSDSPMCMPAGQRSPSPPQRSPLPIRTGEQVPVAL